jgi:hypothetical protein
MIIISHLKPDGIPVCITSCNIKKLIYYLYIPSQHNKYPLQELSSNQKLGDMFRPARGHHQANIRATAKGTSK